MDQAIKKKWVKALRSGKYKQGQGTLRSEHSGRVEFCCLGVLCNLHAQTKPKGIEMQTDPTLYFGAEGFPPYIVQDWAALDEEDPEVNYHGEKTSLSSLNDSHGLNFHEIADVIEQQL